MKDHQGHASDRPKDAAGLCSLGSLCSQNIHLDHIFRPLILCPNRRLPTLVSRMVFEPWTNADRLQPLASLDGESEMVKDPGRSRVLMDGVDAGTRTNIGLETLNFGGVFLQKEVSPLVLAEEFCTNRFRTARLGSQVEKIDGATLDRTDVLGRRLSAGVSTLHARDWGSVFGILAPSDRF